MFLLPLFTTVCVSIKLMTVPSLLISEMRGDEEEDCDLTCLTGMLQNLVFTSSNCRVMNSTPIKQIF